MFRLKDFPIAIMMIATADFLTLGVEGKLAAVPVLTT
jgi:hypothetical protein